MSYEYPGGAEALKELELVNLPSLDEIALRLSRINRFAGEGDRPYSVLAHSICVGLLAVFADGDPGLVYRAFLHDACESETGDVRAGMKTPEQSRLEERMQCEILQSLGSFPACKAQIKRLDTAAGDAEAVVLGVGLVHSVENPDNKAVGLTRTLMDWSAQDQVAFWLSSVRAFMVWAKADGAKAEV